MTAPPHYEQMVLFDIWETTHEVRHGGSPYPIRTYRTVNWLPWFEYLDLDDPYLTRNP